jgi:K+-transporting ATPase ATPase A chain
MNLLQPALFLAVVLVLVRPVGEYIARVFGGERTWLDPVARPVERAIYRLTRIDASADMDWTEYAASFVVFGLVGTVSWARSCCTGCSASNDGCRGSTRRTSPRR